MVDGERGLHRVRKDLAGFLLGCGSSEGTDERAPVAADYSPISKKQ